MYDYKSLDIINDKAKFYVKELWNMEFDLPIKINGRFKNVMGRFKRKRNSDGLRYISDKIELSAELLNDYSNELILDDVLLHELCHWMCYEKGLKYRDGEKDFEEELKRIGSTRTFTTSVGEKVHYAKCEKCGRSILEKRTKNILDRYLNTNRCISRCCHSQLVYGGIVEYETDFKAPNKLKNINDKFKEYYKNNLSKSA